LKEFVTAIEEIEEPKDALKFKVNDQELTAYRPTEGQLALIMLAMGKHASNIDRTAGVVDFFFNLLDEEGQRFMMEGMSRRVNMISPTTMVEILEWMLEEWTGRPFPSPSGSTSSPKNGGRKSTRTTQGQTSSDSVLTGS
jgi:hypothetical protein